MKLIYIAHDVGHVVSKTWRLVHNIYMGFFQGWSATWWKFRHFQHHAKPNVVRIIMTDNDMIHCDNNFVF